MKTLVQWQKERKDEKQLIVQSSLEDGSDGFVPYPIGMGYKFLNCNKNIEYQLGDHENLVLCAIAPTTDGIRRRGQFLTRKMILETLGERNIINKLLSEEEYFAKLPSYKFVISPEGNGIDCHRHYEALLAGCIPIVEYNEVIVKKYGDCPILYTKDYSEITPEYLEKKYEEMKSKVYDFSNIFLSYYQPDLQNIIKWRGNFWCNRILNKSWY
jgi:hypothetical protein